MTQEKLIYRITGCDLRHIQPYSVIPYAFIKEHPSTYEVIPIILPSQKNYEGVDKWSKIVNRHTFQPKRTTSNSEWFMHVKKALVKLIDNVDKAILSVQSSFEELEDSSFINIRPLSARLYYAKFEKEVFTLNCYRISKEKPDSWYVERDKRIINAQKGRYFRGPYGTKVQTKEVPSGRAYFYKRQSLPHNPEKPFEQWTMPDLGILKSVVEQYATDRIEWLRGRKTLYINLLENGIDGNLSNALIALLQD